MNESPNTCERTPDTRVCSFRLKTLPFSLGVIYVVFDMRILDIISVNYFRMRVRISLHDTQNHVLFSVFEGGRTVYMTVNRRDMMMTAGTNARKKPPPSLISSVARGISPCQGQELNCFSRTSKCIGWHVKDKSHPKYI